MLLLMVPEQARDFHCCSFFPVPQALIWKSFFDLKGEDLSEDFCLVFSAF
jgi:hypothetical protein